MYCNQAPSIPPSGLFLLEKEQNNFVGFSHTDTKLATLSPLSPTPNPSELGYKLLTDVNAKCGVYYS